MPSWVPSAPENITRQATHGLSPRSLTTAPERRSATMRLSTGSKARSAQRGNFVVGALMIASSAGACDFRRPLYSRPHPRHHQPELLFRRVSPRNLADEFAPVHH